MKKMVWILGMASILFGIVGFTAASAVSAVSGTSERFADYDNTDPMQAEEEDYMREAVIEEEGEIPRRNSSLKRRMRPLPRMKITKKWTQNPLPKNRKKRSNSRTPFTTGTGGRHP